MRHILLAAAVVAAGAASTASACDRFGPYNRYDRDIVSVNLGALPFFNFGVHVHSHQGPCAETVVLPAPPPVYVQAPPQVVYVPSQPIYVQAPPQPVYMTPPPVYVPQPPPPPVYVPQPPPVTNNVTVVAAPAAPPPADDRPALLGIKYQPGANSSVAVNNGLEFGDAALAHNIGLELRLTNWFAFRSDWERRADSYSLDVIGAKLSVPTKVLSPYISASLSASQADRTPGKFLIGVVASAGLDLKIGKHFFIEAEARYRVAPDACCREVPQVTGLIGAGVAFF